MSLMSSARAQGDDRLAKAHFVRKNDTLGRAGVGCE